VKTRIAPRLYVEGGRVCCAACSAPFAQANASWKQKAALAAVPVSRLPGAGSNIESRVLLRHFSCPHCGLLLDTETALPEDPFLEDVVEV
jgi:acetone carboxylase gamma subunit